MKSRCNKNQLFKTIPPRELVYKVLQTFGLNGLDDTRNFTRQDINKLGTIDKIYLLKPLLEEYYLPCKARTYLNDINEKNIITILRQLIRIYGYSIVSREKYIKGNKFIIYQLISQDDRDYKPLLSIKNNTTECIITFE